MQVDKITFWRSYWNSAKRMPDEARSIFYDAISSMRSKGSSRKTVASPTE